MHCLEGCKNMAVAVLFQMKTTDFPGHVAVLFKVHENPSLRCSQLGWMGTALKNPFSKHVSA